MPRERADLHGHFWNSGMSSWNPIGSIFMSIRVNPNTGRSVNKHWLIACGEGHLKKQKTENVCLRNKIVMLRSL